jgi:PEP-CTERM/exosortase A-associated glycosyltransferase
MIAYRVLHVLDHSWPVLDGYSQRSKSIVTSQARLGMRPSVVTGPPHQLDEPGATELSRDGIQYYRTFAEKGIRAAAIREGWPLLRQLAVVDLLRRRIDELLEEQKFDIVHAHTPALCGLAGLQSARRHEIPFVYEIRSFWEDSAVVQNKTADRSVRYRLGRQLETFVVRRADAVVGISNSILEDLRGRDIDPGKLFHVPNGVEVDRFTSISRDDLLGADLGANGEITIGYLGTLFPWEGIPWLVRAAAELRRRGLQFKLLLVGDGVAAPEVKAAIQEFSAESYVSFVGRVSHDQVLRYYSLMDVLVYPRLNVRTSHVVTPLKPLEAMALGKAILGSNVGGIRELIEPGVTGLLFEPENLEDFCSQAGRLLGNESLRRTLGQAARANVSSEKDWKVLAHRYDEIYAAAIDSAGRNS